MARDGSATGDHVIGRALLTLGVVACILSGCVRGEREPEMARALVVLTSARAATLYSLQPVTSDVELPRLNGYAILGKARLGPADTVKATRQIADGIVENEWLVACFQPRQALRIVADGRVYDYLVCDECSRVAVYLDGGRVGAVDYAGPSTVLEGLLSRAGVPQSNSELAHR